MKRSLALLFGVALMPFVAAVPAHAQATRTWVSGVGDDANPCSRTAPCKTFSGAISKTAASGEINCLDPGGFGAITFTKSLTIDCKGVAGGILVSFTNGVIVNAGVNDKIQLRNLDIIGAGNGTNGIRFLNGRELTVENVRISNFTGIGIDVSKTALGLLFVKNTSITAVGNGIRLATTASNIVANIDNVNIFAVSSAVDVASAGSIANVSNSVLANSANGVVTSGVGIANVESSVLSSNSNGVNAQASGSIIRISGNYFNENTSAIAIGAGATVSSSSDNKILGGGAGANPNGAAVVIR
jgi:hypothetical protein